MCLVAIMNIDKIIKSVNSIEFIVEDHGYRLHGFLTKSLYFNWIAFPELNVCCQLSSFDDVFWNEEALASIFDSPHLVHSALLIISRLKPMFDSDSSYFDGRHFISFREYLFWLETECESLSQQLIEFESYIDFINGLNMLD